MGPVYAEKDKSYQNFEVYTLGDILVTEKGEVATKTGISEEFSAEDIASTNIHSVAEALKYVNGMDVTTGRKNQPDVSIHGFDQDHILVLIDGVPYYETYYGKLDLSQINTENIAKIIIEKGNHSVLYGPNGEGGVINIITKKPSEKLALSGKVEIGQPDARIFSVSNGLKKGIFNYWVNYSHREWDGWRLSDDFEPRLGTIVRKPGKSTQAYIEDDGEYRSNSDYRNNSFWAKFGIEPSKDSEYYINIHSFNTEKGDPPSINSNTIFTSKPAFTTFDRISNYNDWGVDFSGKDKITESLGVMMKLFYHNHLNDYVSYSNEKYKDIMAVSRYKDYILGGMMFFDYQPISWDTVKMSIHYKGDSHKARDDKYLPFAESFSYTGSVGLENNLNYFKNITIVAGICYDWFDVSKAEKNITDKSGAFVRQGEQDTGEIQDELNPMIGVTYNFDKTTKFFASVARKTKFPNLSQLYSSKFGNIDLKAENSINYTVGVSKSISNIWKIDFAPFYHDVSDRISRDYPAPLGIYRNYAKVEMLGFEISSELMPMEDLLLKIGYTYNDAEDKSSKAVTSKVVGIPKHLLNSSVRYKIPFIETSVTLNMINASSSYSQLPTPQNSNIPILKSDDYTVLNFKLSRKIGKFDPFLSVSNLFDKNYESEAGFPDIGRTIWLGVDAKY